MQYIDFNQKKETILYQLLHSSDNIPIENSHALYDYYKYLHYFRHNFLHYLTLQSLNQPWCEEKPIYKYFDFKIPEKYGLKTPDILLKYDDWVIIIDVSISEDIHKTKLQKLEKYKPI